MRQAVAEMQARFPGQSQKHNYYASVVIERAKELQHAAKQERAAILAEQDPLDVHAEHGDWVGPTWHICWDGIERPVMSSVYGELPKCIGCGVEYCAACDLEVQS